MQQVDAELHQFVVIRFVPSSPSQFRNPGRLGKSDPNFRNKNPFKIKTYQAQFFLLAKIITRQALYYKFPIHFIITTMTLIELANPFGAPVYFEATVSSTMIISRELAAQGSPHGTVIAADFQEAGRGRIRERSWETEKGKALAFTLLLRYERMQRALTLRTGLAVSLALEDFSPVLKGRVQIKWPNDIIVDGKKLCGIITEADAGTVHIGIGVNVCQTEFPPALEKKAISVSIASCAAVDPQTRFSLLEKILTRLYSELEAQEQSAAGSGGWHCRIEERLYKKGEYASFAKGAAGSGSIVRGVISGIGPEGELLLLPEGADKLGKPSKPLAFFSGELFGEMLT
jgi:BirA family biotin operon repressor/biotin-[acetyl-CoA-carboxylase] ligase